jgi:hypothetical protein
MSVVASAVLAAVQIIEEKPLAAPSVVFPLIAVGVFALLGATTWAFRDVANRHQGKGGAGSPQGSK